MTLRYTLPPSPCTASSHPISVKAFRWRIWEKTRSDHVTRNTLAARNNAAYGQANGRQSFRTVLRNTGHGNFFLAVFKLELEMDYPSETGLCTVALSPTDTPSSIFSKGRGRLYIGYLKKIIWTDKLSVEVDELTDKVTGIVHSKLTPFHFQIKTYYLP